MSMFGDNTKRNRALTHIPAHSKQQDPGGGPTGTWDDYRYQVQEPTWWTGYGRRQVGDVYGAHEVGGLGSKEREALGSLQQIAQGQKSYALDQAARQQAATDAAVQSQAASAQRGGYDPSVQQAGAWSSAAAQQQIAGQGQLAAQRERQLAARALAQGSAGALSRRQALLGIQAGYAGLGAEERYRQQLAKAQGTDYMLRGKRGAVGLFEGAEKSGRDFTYGGAKAIGSMAGMAGMGG